MSDRAHFADMPTAKVFVNLLAVERELDRLASLRREVLAELGDRANVADLERLFSNIDWSRELAAMEANPPPPTP